jgi:hypothetical protein
MHRANTQPALPAEISERRPAVSAGSRRAPLRRAFGFSRGFARTDYEIARRLREEHLPALHGRFGVEPECGWLPDWQVWRSARPLRRRIPRASAPLFERVFVIRHQHAGCFHIDIHVGQRPLGLRCGRGGRTAIERRVAVGPGDDGKIASDEEGKATLTVRASRQIDIMADRAALGSCAREVLHPVWSVFTLGVGARNDLVERLRARRLRGRECRRRGRSTCFGAARATAANHNGRQSGNRRVSLHVPSCRGSTVYHVRAWGARTPTAAEIAVAVACRRPSASAPRASWNSSPVRTVYRSRYASDTAYQWSGGKLRAATRW